MTVTNILRKAGPFNGDDATVIFAFTYKTFATADVLVVLTDSAGVEAIQILTTDYSVTLNTDQNISPGGTITMVVAPAVGELLTLGSTMDETQPAEIRNQGAFLPNVLENMVDRNTISIQQLAENVSRTLKIPISDDPNRVVELPTEILRANKFVFFDADGNVSVSADLQNAPDASETVRGIAEIATTAEAQTTTDDVRIITPLKLKNSLFDEDNMASNSNSRGATQQSIKSYVDNGTGRKSIQGSTAGNLIRKFELTIARDTSGANGIKCNIITSLGRGFNIFANASTAVSAVFAKGGSASVGSGVQEVTYNLNATGFQVGIDFAHDVSNILVALINFNNGGTNLLTSLDVQSNNFNFNIKDAASGANFDLTTMANAKVIQVTGMYVQGGAA